MSVSTLPVASLRVVWGALISSQLMFVAVLFVLPGVEEPATDPMLLAVLTSAAVAAAIAAIIVPQMMFRNAVKALVIEKEERPDPDAPLGFGKVVVMVKDPKRVLVKLWPSYLTRTILGCAMGEAVSTVGLVVKFTGFEWSFAIPFFVVGIALTSYRYPSEATLAKDVETILGVALTFPRQTS